MDENKERNTPPATQAVLLNERERRGGSQLETEQGERVTNETQGRSPGLRGVKEGMAGSVGSH